MLRINIIAMEKVVREALKREGLPHNTELVERLTATFIEAVYPNSEINK